MYIRNYVDWMAEVARVYSGPEQEQTESRVQCDLSSTHLPHATGHHHHSELHLLLQNSGIQ